MTLWLHFFFFTVFQGVQSAVQLVESGGGVKRPGDSLLLSCRTSGFTFSSYVFVWVRQAPGKGLEWVAYISTASTPIYYLDSVRGRFVISRDDPNSLLKLQMNNLKPEDTAMYYCVRDIRYRWFDYWGPGTFVAVTTASQTAPSLFPLIPSDDTFSGDITIGCLAKDFLPDSLTLSWQKPNNESLESEKIRRFPSIANSNGIYTTSSEATVPADQWETFKPFYCKAELASQTRVARVVRQTPIACEDPEIVLRVPPLGDFLNQNNTATLLCKASKLHTERTTIKWLEDGLVLNSGFTTFAPIRQAHGGYSIISELVITIKDWNNGKTFSCQVQNEKFDQIRNASKLSVCPSESCELTVRVEAFPPSFADMYLSKSAKLTCRISNIPFGQDRDGLNITWIRERDNKALETAIGKPQVQDNKGLVFVDAIATICTEEWESGDIYQCIVKHDLLVSTERRSLKKQNAGDRHPPSVYVLPPPSEQLALRETATLTCLLKDFFPKDFFVKWMQNGEPMAVSDYYTSDPIQESKSRKRYFAYSTLNVREQEWNSGATYTCMVGHEAIPFQTTQKTVDKNTGKPTLVNVSLVLTDVGSTCY